jgi:hypothetical protein
VTSPDRKTLVKPNQTHTRKLKKKHSGSYRRRERRGINHGGYVLQHNSFPQENETKAKEDAWFNKKKTTNLHKKSNPMERNGDNPTIPPPIPGGYFHYPTHASKSICSTEPYFKAAYLFLLHHHLSSLFTHFMHKTLSTLSTAFKMEWHLKFCQTSR